MAKLLRALIALMLALAIPVQSMAVLAAKLCDSSLGGSAPAHRHAGGEGPQSPAAEHPMNDSSCPPCDTCCAGELIPVALGSAERRPAKSAVLAATVHSAPQSDPTPFFRPPRPL